MSHAVHKGAADGFKDGVSYDAHRPSYPSEAVQSLLAHMGLQMRQNAKVVDLGAGTGKFTRLLADREESFAIVAVEPLKSMRGVMEAREMSSVTVLDGSATSIPVEDGWGDGCIAAQAFHWFANEDALAEIRRTLKPGGSFGMIWNIEDYNKPLSWEASTHWEQSLNDLLFSIPVHGISQFRHERWKSVFDTSTKARDMFRVPVGEDQVSWTAWVSDAALRARLATISHITMLEGQQKEGFWASFEEILKGDDVERNEDGELALHGRTHFAWTQAV